MDLVGVILRWTHIASMAYLAGGTLLARFALLPAMDSLSEAEKTKLGDRLAANLRPLTMAACLLAAGAGLANFMRKGVFPGGYHGPFGVKVLLALHVMAVCIIAARPGVAHEKRKRLLTGASVSALIVIALSAYLRSLQ